MNENSSPNSVQPNPAAPAQPAAEEIRKQHIRHEASVKSIGLLYFLSGVLTILMGVILVALGQHINISFRIACAVIFVALGFFQLLVGIGIRALKSWSRLPVGILSGISLLAFPIGTIIHGYFLYLIFCKKGSMVLSPQYQEIIAATPNFKHQTSPVMWLYFVIFIVLFGFMSYAAFLAVP